VPHEGRRLSREEILALYALPAPQVIAAAHRARLRKTDPALVTYAIGGNIDYSNVCVVACRFCAFYRRRYQAGAYTLTRDQIAYQMDALAAIGVQDVLFQGGVNPDLPFDWYLDVMRFMKDEYPAVHIDAFSPEEILGLERLTGCEASEMLAELKEAGMDGLPGAAAEILSDEVRRRIAPGRISTADWFRIIDAAQRLGLHVPWVGMVFGFGETLAHRVNHLLALRAQQDRALQRYGNGFAAFKVWPARLEHTRLKGATGMASADDVAQQYLLEVAVARLALDNFSHHRAVWRTMGFGVAGAALRGGADDLCCTGSINAIDAVTRAAGKHVVEPSRAVIESVERCIVDAGFLPARRDPRYRVLSVRAPARSGSRVVAFGPADGGVKL
jgi:CofH subfamily radical SAM domain protein